MLKLPFADVPAPAAPRPSDAEPTVGDEVNAALVQVLPWGVSLVFHVALVLLAVFAVWSTIAAPEEEIIVPLVKLSDTPGAPLEMREIQKVSQERTERRTIQQSQRPQERPMEQKVELKTSLIGVSGLTGAKAAPFNTTVDAGAQFQTNFFGAGGNAKKIAFVVDATGGLVDLLPIVLKELARSISGLSERQQFTVIFFSGVKGKEVQEVPPRGWKRADASAKARAIEWIAWESGNVNAGFKSNPLQAIQQALQLKPDLIFLLSDAATGQGKFLVEQDYFLREIKRLNASNTKINTIQFIYEDPVAKYGGTSTMKLIADQTGGIYRFVDEEEVYLR